jgi:hypothetical protein
MCADEIVTISKPIGRSYVNSFKVTQQGRDHSSGRNV